MKVLFFEKQRFNQWWIWFLLIGIDILFIYGIIQQVIFKTPFGNNPAPDILLIFFTLIPFGITFLIYKHCLIISVTEATLTYQLKPFQEAVKIDWSAVKKAYVRKYHPTREFGGWGYRVSAKAGKAYNIAGNMGLQLELKNGKKILIGTQKAASLATILEALGFEPE